MLPSWMPIPLAKYERNGAAWSATRRSSASLMTLTTSRRSMIIFWPKNDTSPLLSLNRTWFTDPTSRRRSHAFGRFFGLVCSCWNLREFFRQEFDRLVHLVSEGRIWIVHYEDGSAQIVYHVHLELERLEKSGLE